MWKLVIAIIAVIGYYYIFSPFLDIPIERELKITNNKLTQDVENLRHNVNILDSAYQQIIKRDGFIYHRLFNSDPKNSHYDLEREKTNARAYDNVGIDSLLNILTIKTNLLYSEVKKGTDEIEHLEMKMIKIKESFSFYPSIQPIDNRSFSIPFVSSGMKLNPFYKGQELHRGFDYIIDEGTRIFATADGIISKVGTNVTNKEGLSIEIDHKNGYKTRYANLSKATVRQNEKIKKGDIIAYSGNTGYSFVPHLHYEILYKKNNVAPSDFFFSDLSKTDYFYLGYRLKETIQSCD